MVEKLQNFIDGSFLDPQSGKYIESEDPSLGKVHLLVPDSDSSDVNTAVNAALNAYEKYWNDKIISKQERASIMYQIADLIDKNSVELATAECKDQGKPYSLAINLEVPRAAQNFRHFAGLLLHSKDGWLSDLHGDGKIISQVVRSSLGVVGLITPWNLPLYLLSWKLAPAIAMGNTVVCKPSELTSHTAFLLAQLLGGIKELPAGVINMVFGKGSTAGNALVNHPNVAAISFTGGTQTGVIVANAASSQLKKVSLELGGKNANIIFEDIFDSREAFQNCITTTLRSSFANQGEICLCGSRIFVQKSIYDKFLHEFREKTLISIKVGLPTDPDTTMGALVSKQHMDKVLAYIDIAVKEGGGTIISGGKRIENHKLPGYFVPPTIICNVAMECRAMTEEIFGPVVTVTPFEDEDEVIKMANATKYGLSSSIWTRNLDRANRVARKLQVGTVWVNSWMIRDLSVPFGGVKQSGIGREGGEDSFNFFSEKKTITTAFSS